MASERSIVVLPDTIPALLIKIDTGPKAALATVAPAVIDSLFETSQVKIAILDDITPAFSHSAFVSCKPDMLMSLKLSLQPSLPSLIAMRRPMPPPAPVKKTWS